MYAFNMRWTYRTSLALARFVVRHQDAVHTKRELVRLAARYFHRSEGGIADRLKCLVAPMKQRHSKVYPSIRLSGRFQTYTLSR